MVGTFTRLLFLTIEMAFADAAAVLWSKVSMHASSSAVSSLRCYKRQATQDTSFPEAACFEAKAVALQLFKGCLSKRSFDHF